VHQTTFAPVAGRVHPPGGGQLLDQPQPAAALGPGVKGDQAQQPRAVVPHADVEQVAAQLQPHPQWSPGVDDGVGDELVGEQFGPVDDVRAAQGELPVLEDVTHVQPGGRRRGRGRLQVELVPQVGRPGQDVVKGVLDGVVQRQEVGHAVPPQHLRHGRAGGAQQQGGLRPDGGRVVGDGGEQPGAPRVDGLNPGQVADDPVRPLGQVLEQLLLDPRGCEQVDRPGEADHHAPVAHGVVDLHTGLPGHAPPPAHTAGYPRQQDP
jgi:hypothetical protein